MKIELRMPSTSRQAQIVLGIAENKLNCTATFGGISLGKVLNIAYTKTVQCVSEYASIPEPTSYIVTLKSGKNIQYHQTPLYPHHNSLGKTNKPKYPQRVRQSPFYR